jgi:hypothetical protein
LTCRTSWSLSWRRSVSPTCTTAPTPRRPREYQGAVCMPDVCIRGQHLVEPVPYLMCASWVLFSLEYRVITAMQPLHNGLFRLFKRYTVDPCAVGVAKDSVVAELHKCVLRWHDKRAAHFTRVSAHVWARLYCALQSSPPLPSPSLAFMALAGPPTRPRFFFAQPPLTPVLRPPCRAPLIGFPAQRSSKKACYFVSCVLCCVV